MLVVQWYTVEIFSTFFISFKVHKLPTLWHSMQSWISDTWSLQKLSLNCILSLDRMILCSKMKNGLRKRFLIGTPVQNEKKGKWFKIVYRCFFMNINDFIFINRNYCFKCFDIQCSCWIFTEISQKKELLCVLCLCWING